MGLKMKSRAYKQLLIVVMITLVIGLVSFKLFEVIFVYNWGWESVPNERYPLNTVHASGWEEVGAKADAWLGGYNITGAVIESVTEFDFSDTGPADDHTSVVHREYTGLADTTSSSH